VFFLKTIKVSPVWKSILKLSAILTAGLFANIAIRNPENLGVLQLIAIIPALLFSSLFVILMATMAIHRIKVFIHEDLLGKIVMAAAFILLLIALWPRISSDFGW